MAPKKSIDLEMVSRMCAIHCTAEEIAGVLGVDADTLNARIKESCGKSFSEYFREHSAKGKMSLRRKQWEIAQAGNVPMNIWLGKSWLKQNVETEEGAELTDLVKAINLVSKINQNT